MLEKILESIAQTLKNNDISNVYTMFNALPVENRGKKIYTLVGIDSFRYDSPVVNPQVMYMPFEAELEIKLIAPCEYDLHALYTYFDTHIVPPLINITSINSSLKCMSAGIDHNINRLVLKSKFSVSGMIKTERVIL